MDHTSAPSPCSRSQLGTVTLCPEIHNAMYSVLVLSRTPVPGHVCASQTNISQIVRFRTGRPPEAERSSCSSLLNLSLSSLVTLINTCTCQTARKCHALPRQLRSGLEVCSIYAPHSKTHHVKLIIPLNLKSTSHWSKLTSIFPEARQLIGAM